MMKEIHLWFEAHVKHPVCFVEDEVGDPLQVCHLHLDHVDHPARGRDRYLRPLLECLALLVLISTTVGANNLEK